VASDYDELGEFHDLFMDDRWQQLGPALGEAFGSLTADDLVLDIGAGTGIGTRVLAASTGARILAVEPSLTMRAVLTARVANGADLVERVSILAEPVPDVLDQIHEPIAGFVCAHVLNHLTPEQRATLWAGLLPRLAADAVGVITVDRDDAQVGASTEEFVEERRIGAFRYVARHLPTGDASQTVSEYEVWDGERRIRHARFEGTRNRVRVGEIVAAGLAVDPRGGGVALVTRRIAG
jgi:SAM-dependent methyltransferase